MRSKIAGDNSGFHVLLSGDEAVARGAVEAGVKVAASYPGTPATEILEAIAEVAKEYGIYVEWSINEIVAMEEKLKRFESGMDNDLDSVLG